MSSQVNIAGIFCEDIREEINNRHSLTGVFPDTLYVPSVPGALDRLAIYVRVHIAPNFEVKNLSLDLAVPGSDPVQISNFDLTEIAAEQEKALKDGKPHAGFIFRASSAPAAVPAEGFFTAYVRINSDEIVACALKIEVKKP